jgi:membrane protein
MSAGLRDGRRGWLVADTTVVEIPVAETLWRKFRRGTIIAGRATYEGLKEFYLSENLTFASSIAYYSLLSILPFILLVFTILSRVAVTQSGDEMAVVALLERALPRNLDFLVLSERVRALQKSPIQFTILGTLVTMWAAMGVFGAVTSAVNHAWGVEKNYNFFMHKVVAFVMLLVAAILFMVALVAVGAVQISQASWFVQPTDYFPWLTGVGSFVSRNALLPATVVAAGLVYYFLPNVKVRMRDVWFGAVLAAVLWRLALEGFSLYLREFASFGVHGSIGAVMAFLVWVYISAVIFLYGVEVTAAYARLRQKVPE